MAASKRKSALLWISALLLLMAGATLEGTKVTRIDY